ncbi:EAL domain-containing protein [Marinobacter sp. ELB17]|uniref:EAL domain-containing protein n=1 Tax=Marinobacter sp. ELB17 TaxID=270374 RepID=UPI0000F36098|nr:EAL domain-containing protein [Marinobacter sp. ELB17]EAZ97370.1 sensory box protein [Marinobacter sp. ELB17]
MFGVNYPVRPVILIVAEQTGQIVHLGLWILRQACIEIADFIASREQALRVAVNISSLQFIRDGFLDDVCRVAAIV